jgi:hypothetical protein
MTRLIVAILFLTVANPAIGERQASEAEKAADSKDRVVCKRFLRTGSLVDGYRTCKTKGEWERERDNLRSLSSSSSCRNAANGGPC